MIKCHNDETPMQDCGKQLLDSMTSLAKALAQAEGDQRYQKTLKKQQEKIDNPELSPSAKVLSTMSQESLSWLDFAGALSKNHKISLTKNSSIDLSESVQQSFSEASNIKLNDTLSFEQFMQDYQTE